MNDAVIQCVNVAKTYKEADIEVDVLRDLNFSVAKGELVAIIGASGAGKSTLLHLMGGLDRVSEGQVLVSGVDIATLSETQKGILRNQQLGFVYQFHHLLPEFNALENVCMPLLIRGLKPKQAEDKAAAFIEKVGLSARTKHRVGELSGGERQRIAIARALVTEPRCVLADEPTGNLDQGTAEIVFELMMELNRETRTSFVVVTHNEALANKLDRVLELKEKQLHDH